MRKFSFLLVALALAFTTSACNAKPQTNTVPETTQTVSQSSQEAQAEAPAPAEGEGGQQVSAAAQDKAAKASSDAPKIMVTYFSCTNNTAKVAGTIAETLGAEQYRITPEQEYTEADLDYRDDNSRSCREHKDSSIRPAIKGEHVNLDGYDVVFIGYPIWWAEAPNIVYGFVESIDLNDKVVVPFSTSGGSGLGQSGIHLKERCHAGGTWLEGRDFYNGGTTEEVQNWAKELKLK